MKRNIGFTLFFCLGLITITFYGFKSTVLISNVNNRVNAEVISNLGFFENELKQFEELCATSPSKYQAKGKFINLRLAYKRIEFYIEYFNASQLEDLNGTITKKIAFDASTEDVLEPHGLQVIESLIYNSDNIDYSKLQNELQRMISVVQEIILLNSAITLAEEDIYNALQLELIRIQSLGFSGFDVSLSSNNAIKESEVALLLTLKYISWYADLLPSTSDLTKEVARLTTKIEQAFVLQEKFKTFNRAFFYSRLLNPYYVQVVRLRKELSLTGTFLTSIDLAAESIFTSTAWESDYFTKFGPYIDNPEQQELGRLLFFDPILSGNNQRACASCHNPDLFFTDGFKKSIAFSQESSIARNAPAIINAALQSAQFYDHRVASLEDQLSFVILNPDEVHGDFKDIVNKLNTVEEYKIRFRKAFDGTEDTIVSQVSIQKAITAFELTLIDFNSPFDDFMNGTDTAISRLAQQGFNLFMGKAKCGTCHFLPGFGGTLPPLFNRTEFEIIGVPSTVDNTSLDSDLGVGAVSHKPLHNFAFKTNTVRNVGKTSPYMHNGIYKSLTEVVEFYKKGGGAGLGYDVPNQTLSKDELKIVTKEIRALVAFMESLSSKTDFTKLRPSVLPKSSLDSLNNRIVGGVY